MISLQLHAIAIAKIINFALAVPWYGHLNDHIIEYRFQRELQQRCRCGA
jgi:hypothetical protein